MASTSTPQPLEAIIVPGGGLTEDGLPTGWVRERLMRAMELYEAAPADRKPFIVTLSGGTTHKPMPVHPASGFQVGEAEASARFLVRDHKVPPEHVLEENFSLDTIGNAYFLRTFHTDVACLRRLHVITNTFHMQRTAAIFKKVFGLPPVSGPEYVLSFEEVPDTGVEPATLASRCEREAKSLVGFNATSAAWNTMQDLHRFVFLQHSAYAARRLMVDREPVSEEVRKSY